ncbi:hypothetical protein ABFX02_13G074700 [Erythranthe guttata]
MEITETYRRNLSIDRLSELPDSVLCYILSFLPTQKSVATSILSRRWRYLWTDVPNLYFHNENQGTIDRVLSLYNLRNIINFRLSDKIDCDDYQIGTWITFAIERNVQNLDIWRQSADVFLPRSLFTSKTLVDLRLHCCGEFPNIGSAVSLPLLKKLRLIFIRGHEFLPHLLSGCPVLEELVLYLSFEYRSFTISSPTIKKLLIDIYSEIRKDPDEMYYTGYSLEIDTPAIVYLQLFDSANYHIKFGSVASLTEASVYIQDYRNDFLYSRSVVEFIERLRNVRCLNLDLSHRAENIHSVFAARTISFRNVTKLEMTSDCRFLPKLLENANNLEILILREVNEKIDRWMDPQQVPTCLVSRLRTITLFRFVRTKHEFKAVKYLLKNAIILEKIEIVYPCYLISKKRIYMLDKISSFERGSSACEVVAYVG